LFVFTLVLNQNHTAIAQQQKLQGMQNNRTSSSLTKQQLLNGNSFQIDNMTFSHRTASVNGIQLHYVIGGHGNPVVLLHGWPEAWYEWRHVRGLGYDLTLSHVKSIDSGFPISEASNKAPFKEILDFGFVRCCHFHLTSTRFHFSGKARLLLLRYMLF
jgi:hypothetical protein